ncbi:EscC/YscC/HrcC family type III secretion system outer membrane ring protein [bacterium]|nr:EscC/YscC/HrcC family type III secretion system outer membrane ring protein [bacterium]
MPRWNQILPVLLIAVAVASPCFAQEAWRQGTYFKRQVTEQPIPIRQLLNDFGKSQGVSVMISNDIPADMLVSTQYSPMPPEQYLNAITQDNGLFWYYSSGVIHVLPNTSMQSVLLPINAVDLERLIETLKRLGIYSDRLPLTADPEFGLVYATGPPDYIAKVQEILKGIEYRARQKASVDIDVEVFPLQYAWADDQTITIGRNEVLVPGVATILRGVLGNQQQQQVVNTGVVRRPLPNNLPSLRGMGLIGPYNQAIADAEGAAINSQIAAAQAQAQYQASTQAEAQIQAAIDARNRGEGPAGVFEQAEADLAAGVTAVIYPDPRLNAVVVRDVRERMDSYREIIRNLDRPVGLVQIKASIIDIDETRAFQLGPPFNSLWNQSGQTEQLGFRLDTSNASSLLNTPNPGNLTLSLAKGQMTQFMMNIKALETDGDARMIAKPAVVTLDNTEAFLEESEEFFVRVSGFQQVDLFNVVVGTKLNIVPHIIDAPEGRRVKLTVRVEDGTRSQTSSVDEIPVISRNTVNTQAILLEGQSLLVGGLMRENETKTVKGVPVLGRIPKLGMFFRETVHETQRLERLVLLTPTIIDLPYGGENCPGGVNPQQFNSPGNMPPTQYESIPAPPQTSFEQHEEKLQPVHSLGPQSGGPTRVQSLTTMPFQSRPPGHPIDNRQPEHQPSDSIGQASFEVPLATPAHNGELRRFPSIDSEIPPRYAVPRSTQPTYVAPWEVPGNGYR